MKLSERVERLPPYLFARISQLIAQKRSAGVDVISFGIGDPDLPTPGHILDALKRAADDPANHRYPETEGLPALRAAMAGWYHRRHGVALDPDAEVVSLIGSKEGIGHFPLCVVDPGDVVLVTDPGYPVYEVGAMFAGADVARLPLREEDGWLPRLDEVPDSVAARARLLWLNYPNNPTGAVASEAFFERAVAWARRRDIWIAHDLAYADVTFDGYVAPSILEVDGAREVAIEFNSLSKSFNMTGWRIAMAVGNPTLIDALTRVKSNLDSGVPQAIQEMAIAALEGPLDEIESHNKIYQRRRDRAVEALRALGLRVDPPSASLYVWARLPAGEQSSAAYAERLLEETGVVVTPGIGYGEAGEGYVRLSLTLPDERVDEGLSRLAAFARRSRRA